MSDMEPTEIERVVEEKVITATRYNAYFWMVMVFLAVTGPAIAIFISSINLHKSERKLCAVVIMSDDQYRKTPPTSELGRQQSANFTRLRQQLGCPPYEEK